MNTIFWVGKIFDLGGIGILVARKWIDKIFHVKHVSNTLIIIRLLIGKRIVAIVSTYTPRQGLGEDVKDKFCEDLISLVSKVGRNELIMIGGDLNGHVGKNASGYDGIHGDFGYGVRNLEEKRMFEMRSALDTTVCNMFFIKRDSQLITYI